MVFWCPGTAILGVAIVGGAVASEKIDENHESHGTCKGGAQEIDVFKSPRFRCFDVLIASIEGAKGPYEATALKST